MKNYYTIFVIILLMQSVYSQKNDQFVTDIAYLPEILISSSNTQTALDFYSINIIDYRVFGESVLTLKKEKGHYLLGIEHDSKPAEAYPLSIKRPRSIFIDCFNNVHILNDNFAYQVYISDKVEIVEQVILEEFKNSVGNCKGEFSDVLIFDKLSNNNQQYTVTMFDKTTNETLVLFDESDEVALKSFEKAHLNDGFGSYKNWNAALFYPFKRYYQFNRRKYGYNPITQNLRQNSSKGTNAELANSRMNSLLEHDSYRPNFLFDRYRSPNSYKVDFFEEMLFRYIKSVKVKINTFKIGEAIVIVDQLNSEVKLYNQKGMLLKTSSLDFSGEIIEIIQDPSTGDLFFTSASNQLFKIHKLDVKTGLTSYSGGFKNISLTKSRKIYDGWIYYRVLKNGYHKLYRTRLRS